MIPPKRRYFPGLITLLGLPLLLLAYWLAPGPVSPIDHAIILPIILPANDRPDTRGKSFTDKLLFQQISGKQLLTIDLNEKPATETYLIGAKRRFIIREIERLHFLHDTTTVMKIHLGENNSYGDFTWLIKQARLYKVERYAFVGNDFYLLSNQMAQDSIPFQARTPLLLLIF